MNRYYSLVQNGTTADIDIYGDITSYPWMESDVSAYNLSKVLAELDGVDTINVNINSYGGEVAEGLAIYNALKRHSAKVVTRCDGFACSIASVIFMAGDERVMSDASLLMIHNAWSYAKGNAAELRKQADDLDTITQASKNAYMACIGITEDELTALMDSEKWLSASEALEMGFASSVETYTAENVSQSAREAVMDAVMGKLHVIETKPVPKANAAGANDEPQEAGTDCDPDDPDDDDMDDDMDDDPDDDDDDPNCKCGDDEDKDKQQVSASFFSMAFK